MTTPFEEHGDILVKRDDLYERSGQRGALVKASMVDAPVGASHPYFARYASMMQVPDESYVAVMARSPFWVSGVESVAERNSVHVVVGILER